MAAVFDVVGPIQEVIGLVEQLLERYEAYKANPGDLNDLVNTYNRLKSQVTPLEEQHKEEEGRKQIPENNQQVIQDTIEELKDGLSSDIDLIEKKLRRMTYCLYRIFRANSTATMVELLKVNAETAAKHVNDLSRLFATVAVIREVASENREAVLAGQNMRAEDVKDRVDERADQLMRHQSRTRRELIRQVQEAQGSVARGDEFCPVEDGQAVEGNPTRLTLDLNAMGEDGKPLTYEAKLKKAVLKASVDATGTSDPAIVACRGGSGMGKSCALRALAHDSDVQKQFPNGSYYIQLGKDATMGDLMKQLCDIVESTGGRALSKELKEENRLPSLVTKVRLWFSTCKDKDKSSWLLLLDDVWPINDITSRVVMQLSALMAPGSGSCLAFTTRSLDLSVNSGEVVPFEARVKLGSQSREMLFRAAGLKEEEVMRSPSMPLANDVLQVCGGLPVALMVSGNTLRVLCSTYEGNWPEALKKYAESLVARRNRLLNTDAQVYASISSTLTTALDVLDRRESQMEMPPGVQFSARELHQALGVLQKQAWAPVGMLRRLWELWNEEVTLQVMKLMENVGLADIVPRKVNGRMVEGLRIHDLIHDFCQHLAGRGISVWHKRLLNNYLPLPAVTEGEECHCREWWSIDLEEDAYISQNVCRHLIGAELSQEALKLLSNPKWTVAHFLASGVTEVEYAYALVAEHEKGKTPTTGQSGADNAQIVLNTISGALSLASEFVSRNPSEVWFQLYARIMPVSADNKDLCEYLNQIERCAERPWIRPLSNCLPGPGGALKQTQVFDVIVIRVFVLNDRLVVCGVSNDQFPMVLELVNGEEAKTTLWKSPDVHPTGGRFVQNDEPLFSSMDCSRDGMRVAVGLNDGSLKIWDVRKRRRVLDDRVHDETVDFLLFSPDGAMLASCSGDGTILLLNTETGMPICDALREHNKPVGCAAFSADGERLASADLYGQLCLWNVKEKRLERKLAPSDRAITCVAFSKGQKKVVAGYSHGELIVFDVESGTRITPYFLAHDGTVQCVAFSDDGKRLASGSFDYSIRIWDMQAESSFSPRLVGHSRAVSDVVFSQDGKALISASYDGSVRYWTVPELTKTANTTNGNEVVAFPPSTEVHNTACWAYSEVADMFACGFSNGDVLVWDCKRSSPEMHVLKGHEEHINAMEFSSDGSLLYARSHRGDIIFWNTVSLAETGRLEKDDRLRFECTALSWDGSVLAAVTWRPYLHIDIWDISETKRLSSWRPAGQQGHISTIEFSRDDKLVATGCDYATVRIWDRQEGLQLGRTLEGHTGSIKCISFSQDGKRLVTGSADATAQVWDLQSMSQVAVLKGHEGYVFSVAFSDVPSRVVSAGDDNKCRLWDIASGTCLAVDPFSSIGVRPHPFMRGTGGEVGCETPEPLCLRYAKDKVMYGTSKQSKVILTLESDAYWAYLEKSKMVFAVTRNDVHFFKVFFS